MVGGAFDVTVGPLMKLWGFRMERRDVVTQAMVDSVRPFAHLRMTSSSSRPQVDVEGDAQSGGTLRKRDPRVELDFNAVAQGLHRGCHGPSAAWIEG